MNIDIALPKLSTLLSQHQLDIFHRGSKAYILAWAIVLSCFEGESDVSIWLVNLDSDQPKHFSCHLNASLAVSQALQSTVAEDTAEVRKGWHAESSVILLNVNLTKRDYVDLQSKVRRILASAFLDIWKLICLSD